MSGSALERLGKWIDLSAENNEQDSYLLRSPRALPDESHFQKRQCSCKKVAGEWICSGRKWFDSFPFMRITDEKLTCWIAPEVSQTRLSLLSVNALARSFPTGNGYVEVLSAHVIYPTWSRSTRYAVVGDVVEDIKRGGLSTFHQVADGKAHPRFLWSSCT